MREVAWAPVLRRSVAITSVVCSALVFTGGAGAATGRQPHASGQSGTPVINAPAKKSLSSLTWSIFPYPPSSIDPVKFDDYPEDIIIPNMCESLLRQEPGMKTVPNLAQSWKQKNPTTLVFAIRRGVHFWDGTTMNAADVAFSLKRNMQASAQSTYAAYFSAVKSIAATGPYQLTIRLKAPDAIFLPELATLGGAVVEPAYVKKEGSKFGTPAGGVMCTGPYKLKSWNGTSSLVMTANPHYWNKSLQPKVKKITFQWPTDPGQIANGYATGALQGGFFLNATDLPPLRQSTAGKLYVGPASQTMEVMAMITVGTKGAIANPLVRRALFMAVDRKGLIQAAEQGAGTPGFADAAPGYWSYDRAAFQAAYNKIAKAAQNAGEASKLVKQAGAVAKQPIVLAIPSGSQEVADVGQVVQQSAAKAGLHVVIHVVPNDQYGAVFTDPAARKGDDLLFTINYDQVPDPLALYDDIAQPTGISNFNGYDNPKVIALLNRAGATTNLSTRAQLVIKAQSMVMQDLPWIPLDFRPATTFVRKGICGVPLDFSSMTSLWAASVGGC